MANLYVRFLARGCLRKMQLRNEGKKGGVGKDKRMKDRRNIRKVGSWPDFNPITHIY